jgi:glycosyltransferase involved in cell wall biosynthesis
VSPRNDIAIYSPYAFAFYEKPVDKRAHRGGGAELQTMLLARELVRNGRRTAHIVYPVAQRAEPDPLSPEIVERSPRAERRNVLGKLGETLGVWRALAKADARVYVFRTGLSGGIAAFLVGAVFTTLRRRRLVLAASNDLDFVYGDRTDRSRLTQLLYRLALRRTHRVVVQTEQQLELARAALGGEERARLIPSFTDALASSPEPGEPDAFLWIGRLVDYKQPLLYADLARALPEIRFRMVRRITGETPRALLRDLEEAAARTPNLELLANMAREDLLEWMRHSYAVVNTSTHEGLPNVFMEGWAVGVPALSFEFDADGRVERERMGLFADGSWERFVADAGRLWEDPELRRELGRNGRAYVERTHSPQAVGERWAAVLAEAA